MSFWDNVKKITRPYSDEEYDDYDDEDEYLDEYEDEPEEPVRRAPKSRSTRRAPKAAPAPEPEVEQDEDDYAFESIPNPTPAAANNPVSSGNEFSGRVVPMNRSNAKSGIVLFRPTQFNDTSKAADDIKANKAIIVNMENVDKALARRVVDFLSGCVYAVNGKVRKIAQSAYLFCPDNVEISGDLENLQVEVENYV